MLPARRLTPKSTLRNNRPPALHLSHSERHTDRYRGYRYSKRVAHRYIIVGNAPNGGAIRDTVEAATPSQWRLLRRSATVLQALPTG